MPTSLYGHNVSYGLLTASSQPSLLRIVVSKDDNISFTPFNNYSEYNIISFTRLIKIFQPSFHLSNNVIAFRYYDDKVL